MAKLTNKFNIPQQIVSAVMRDPYTRGNSRISVTQLIKPPRIVQLEERHNDEIEEDASDRIWSLLGQVCHSILERSDQTGAIHEERIATEVLGWRVSGQSDCYVTQQFDFERGCYYEISPAIRDYKLIKTMAGGFDHPDWEQQLNLLAYLWQEQGFPVSRLEIVAIFRDWSKVLYERGEHGYPKAVEVYRQKMWPLEEQERFLIERVTLHQMAVGLKDEYLPLCTPEEQWRRPPKWAVMKTGNKKASKVCNSIAEAQAYIDSLPKEKSKYKIEHRPSVATRCEMFCSAAPFCDQYAAEKAADERNREKQAA